MSETKLGVRSTFSGAWVFVMATIGSAVGLGNIWKFPYMVGLYGGAAFVLVYFACMLVFALPLAMSEVMLGRRAKCCAPDAYEKLARESGRTGLWRYLGFFALLGCVLTIAFYSVVGGWVLNYLFESFTGFPGATADSMQTEFGAFLGSAVQQVVWHTLFLLSGCFIIVLGVDKGIGRANAVMMPALFFILLFLLIYAFIYGDIQKSFDYMFTADWRALTPKVLLAALGHSFFSMSIGFGALMIYGSYVKEQVNIAASTLYVAAANLFIAVLAGLSIFAFVFGAGLEPSAGPGLVMQALPLVFSKMPFSQVVAPLFYILLYFATITSAISIIEPMAAYLIETVPSLGRKKATLILFFVVWVCGIVVALGFNEWSNVTIFGSNIFDTLDALTSRFIMPISAMLSAVFIGWFMNRQLVQHEIHLKTWQWSLWFFILRFVAPPCILIVFLSGFDFF